MLFANKGIRLQFHFFKQFMDMRGKTTDFTFSHFLVVLLEEKDQEIIKWTSTMNSVIRCKDINIKALVTEVEGKITKLP